MASTPRRNYLTRFVRPTVIEIWAPACSACRAMTPHLEEAALRYAGDVDLLMIDASRNPGIIRELGVLGTPTLIGVRNGSEVFRTTGRRGPTELGALFDSLAKPQNPPAGRGASRVDLSLRAIAGAALIAAGIVAGPAWALLAIGTLTLASTFPAAARLLLSRT